MLMVSKLKMFERQMVFMKWGNSEGYGRINYVGHDFLEFEIFDTDILEYTDKIERFSVDECFLDMTNFLMGDTLLYKAQEINRRVK